MSFWSVAAGLTLGIAAALHVSRRLVPSRRRITDRHEQLPEGWTR